MIRVLLVLLASTAIGLAQQPSAKVDLEREARRKPGLPHPLVPRHLEESSSVSIQVPEFGSWGNTQCDASGAVYFWADTGSIDYGTVLKISADGTNSTVFQLPRETDEGGRSLFEGFSVTPSGTLRMLYKEEKTLQLRIAEFSTDGSFKRGVHLETPDYVVGKDFVAYEDGTVWLSAYYAPKADESLRGKGYVAIFDASGKVSKRLDSFLPARDFHDTGFRGLEGNVTLSRDGNLYILAPGKVVVMSESGEILRKIPFTKTNPEQLATRIDLSGGLLAITLITMVKNQPHEQFLLLDSVTGDPYALYDLAGPQRFMLCFDRQEGFTFLGGDKSSVKFLRYALR